MSSFRKRKLSTSITQASFSPKGSLMIQKTLPSQTIKTAIKQVSLDLWLQPTDTSSSHNDQNKNHVEIEKYGWQF